MKNHRKKSGRDGLEPSGLAVEPLVKWAGGKRWLAPTLAPTIASHLDAVPGSRYFEPFLGGGAVALRLAERPMVLADVEVPLIELYRAVVDNWREVSMELSALVAAGTDRETYFRIRAHSPSSRSAGAARLLYLNRLAFNGLYRTNKNGAFNVPYGDYRSPSFPSGAHLAKVSGALSRASISPSDFEGTLASCGQGDVAFADPPYHSSGTGFRKYHRLSFSAEDQERLATTLRSAHDRGAIVFSTNSDEPLVRELYSPWAQITSTLERRAINCVGNGRGGVRCLLISNRPFTFRSPKGGLTHATTR